MVRDNVGILGVAGPLVLTAAPSLPDESVVVALVDVELVDELVEPTDCPLSGCPVNEGRPVNDCSRVMS